MRRYSLPSSSARSTSTTMPSRARTFSGRSFRSRAASSTPMTFPRSFLPISRTPPCALANPQIHFRYSSRHDRFHSRFWASLVRAASRPAISGNVTPASSPVRPVARWIRALRAEHGRRRGERQRGCPLSRPPRIRSRGCCPASTCETGCPTTPPIAAPGEKRRRPDATPPREVSESPGSARPVVNETPQFRDAPPSSRTGGGSDRTPRARTGSACRSPVRAPSR